MRPFMISRVKASRAIFASDRIKAGECNRFRGIIDDQVDSGSLLQRPDIAAFPADQSAFHFIIRNRNHRNGSFGDDFGSGALDSLCQDFLGFFIGLLLQG